MPVASAVSKEVEPEGSLHPRGVPCAFAGLSGVLHPADGAVGVVLCAPWGFEGLTMHKGWRLLAEALAARGYPCLRFDYPGAGDSSGRATDPASVQEWIGAVGAAADFLREASGADRLVFVGQTLGATLAVMAARQRRDVVALHLIAPVVKGRAHVRELAATAKLVADKLGIALENDGQGAEALSVMGFDLSATMVDSLKALDLTALDSLGVADVVVYDQDGRKAGADALAHFETLGARVAFEPVEPFHLMVSDATVIQPLPVRPERLLALLEAQHPAGTRRRAPIAIPSPILQVDTTCCEEPIRFGTDSSLFGILCTPRRVHHDRPAVILLNRGLNPHIGWRRVSVDHARDLAAAGITSLRFDVAGLGESADVPGRPPNLMYSDLLLPDIRAAVDALVKRGHVRIMLAGVCSGAYMALIAAAADPRVTDVVAVNAQRFLWNPKENVEDFIRFGLRSVDDYVGDIRSGGALKKLIRSRRRIVPALTFLAKTKAKAAMARLPLRLRSLLLRGSMAARVERMFAGFAARGARVSLCYSAGDPGLKELSTYFGPAGRNLRHSNVTVSIIPDADHNLTTTRASNCMRDHMIAVANERAPREVSASLRAVGGTSRHMCPT